jgi:hypothetical protein
MHIDAFRPPCIRARIVAVHNRFNVKFISFCIGFLSVVFHLFAGILKWRLAVSDEDMVPITVNFWPSSENGRSVVSVEYSVRDDFLGRGGDAAFVLQNLSLSLPCPSRQAPDVTQVQRSDSLTSEPTALLSAL